MVKGAGPKNALQRRHDAMTPRQMEKSLVTMGLVVKGKLWREIKALGGYSWSEFSRLLAKYPDLSRAYQEARALSGTSFEDKALELAEKLVGPNEFTGTGVRALEVAMNQYRWSATKRDPRGYAEAGASTGVMVPIQIVTSLNLGQPGAEDIQAPQNIFEFAAEVGAKGAGEKDIREVLEDGGYEVAFDIPASGPEEPAEGIELSEGEILPEEPETAPSGLPVALEEVREKVGLPLEVPAAIKRRPSPGRPRKKHKDAQQTSVTKTSYDRMKKSPAVRRALGLPEEDTE